MSSCTREEAKIPNYLTEQDKQLLKVQSILVQRCTEDIWIEELKYEQDPIDIVISPHKMILVAVPGEYVYTGNYYLDGSYIGYVSTRPFRIKLYPDKLILIEKTTTGAIQTNVINFTVPR